MYLVCVYIYIHMSLCVLVSMRAIVYEVDAITLPDVFLLRIYKCLCVCIYIGMDQGVVARAYSMNFKVIVACSLTILFMFMLKQSSTPSEQVINCYCVIGNLFSLYISIDASFFAM